MKQSERILKTEIHHEKSISHDLAFFQKQLSQYCPQQVFTVINLLNLVVGLTVFILFSEVINYELDYDKFNTNSIRFTGYKPDRKILTPSTIAPTVRQPFGTT
jgi:hypothetical protein